MRFRCLWCSGCFLVRCSATARTGMVRLPCRRFSVGMARRSARQALRRIARHRVRIPIRLLIGIDRRLVAAMPPRHSPRTFVVDGTTLSMPDRPANQVAWPQSHSQKEGCGFPNHASRRLFPSGDRSVNRRERIPYPTLVFGLKNKR